MKKECFASPVPCNGCGKSGLYCFLLIKIITVLRNPVSKGVNINYLY